MDLRHGETKALVSPGYASIGIAEEQTDMLHYHSVEGIGADDGLHFHKALVGNVVINLWTLADEGIRRWIIRLLETALVRARGLHEHDLTAMYLHSVSPS